MLLIDTTVLQLHAISHFVSMITILLSIPWVLCVRQSSFYVERISTTFRPPSVLPPTSLKRHNKRHNKRQGHRARTPGCKGQPALKAYREAKFRQKRLQGRPHDFLPRLHDTRLAQKACTGQPVRTAVRANQRFCLQTTLRHRIQADRGPVCAREA